MSDFKTPNSSGSPPGPPRSIPTPCVQVCTVDGQSGLCLGCFRTLGEIGGWSRYSDEERNAIMAELPTRGSRLSAALSKPSG
jgi:uncharacterized protein